MQREWQAGDTVSISAKLATINGPDSGAEGSYTRVYFPGIVAPVTVADRDILNLSLLERRLAWLESRVD